MGADKKKLSNLFRNFSIILFFFLIKSEPSFGQDQFWENINGPTSGGIYSIAIDSNIIYCAGNGGVFSSNDFGESWESLGLGDQTVRKIGVIAGNLMVITYQGCFRKGVNDSVWIKVKQGGWQSMCIKDSIVFIGSEYEGIFRSYNLGKTWVSANNGIDNKDIEEIFITSNNICLAGAAGTSGSGVFRSTNFGDSWERIDLYQYAWNIEGITELNNNLYAFDFTNKAVLYKSTDYGLTWFLPPGTTAPSDIISSIYSDQGGIYVVVYHYGIFRTTNEGITWSGFNNGLGNENAFSVSSNNTHLFAATYDGFYKAPKSKIVWEKKSDGINNAWITSLGVVDNKLFVGTYGSGLFIDDGSGFRRIEVRGGQMFILDITVFNKKIYVITSSWSPSTWAKFFVSSDMGSSWAEVKDGFDTEGLESIAANDKFVYTGTWYGLFRKPMNGSTWEKLLNGMPNNANTSSVSTSDSVVIVTNGTSQIYRSTDYGDSWQTAVIPKLYSGSKVVSTKKGEFYIGSSQVNTVSKSTDYGATWQSLATPLFNSAVQAFYAMDDEVFVGLSDNGLLISSDRGNSWKTGDIGLDSKNITSLASRGDIVYVGTKNGGIFRRLTDYTQPQTGKTLYNDTQINFNWTATLGIDTYRFQLAADSLFTNILVDEMNIRDTAYMVNSLDYNKIYFWRVSSITKHWNDHFSAAKKVEIGSPLNFTLSQNYPNPFNPSTKIKYTLPTASNVNITVHNTLGQIVRTFNEGEKEAGSYTINFNGEGLSSGVYLYSINAVSVDGKENFRATKKMLLVK